MKLNLFAIAVFLTPLCLTLPAQAANPEHLQEFLDTQECIEWC